jgi:hypothetical protein
MPKKLTNKDVDERIADKPIKRVGDYVNSKTKIGFRCNADGCGYHWEAVAGDIFGGHGCPACAGVVKLTNEIVDERISDRPIKRVGDYVSTPTKIEWACTDCDYNWLARPRDIFSGRGCPACAYQSRNAERKLTNEMVDKRIADRPIKRIGDYVNADTSIEWACTDCDHHWETSPDHISNGSGCPACYIKNRTITNEIVDARIADRPIKRVGDFVDTDTKIEWACADCDHHWEAKPNAIFIGTGCPACTDYSFDPTAPAILYLIKVGDLYKVGITSRSVKERYKTEGVKYEVVEEINFDTGAEAVEFEREIKKEFADYLYDGPQIFRKTANTEIFTINILEGAR